jgi:transglutaminase-like putative cysteine protease
MTIEKKPDRQYLLPTSIIDSDHSEIRNYAGRVVSGMDDQLEKAVKLFYAVRDQIAYEFIFPHLPEYYRSSNVLKRGRGFCVSKAALLCALGRAVGIPSRVCFANVRNHLTTEQAKKYVGSNVFVYHGMAEFYLEGRWVKATPAFNIEFCQKFGVKPLDFNGREDSIFQPYDTQKQQYMEYIVYHGCFADVPVPEIVAAWVDSYGESRVREWTKDAEKVIGASLGH